MRNEHLRRKINIHTIKGEKMKRTKNTIRTMEQHRNPLTKEGPNYDEPKLYKIRRSRRGHVSNAR